ncbi:SDR family NAD(P)-dependent oxidoreductase [Ottowia sp.]|uniref:SDR family NAD(P)-dependent oxidoreductase n=1 Tax=Ottowia sp. TaxID=1898956 RepID=UPI0039E23E15
MPASRKPSIRKPASRKAADLGRALITGASAGIGAELAREFARHGHPLTLVARRKEALAALAAELTREHGVDVKIIAQDLAAPGGPAAVVKAAQAGGQTIGILVNNAGIVDTGPFAQAATERLLALVDLNVRAMTEMTSRLLPGMVERGAGRVLNVSSLSAFQPVPTMGTYAASKVFVLSLTEALSEELHGTGVSVTALCPGFTQTDMMGEIQAGSAAIRKLPQQMLSKPADVAALGYRALMSGQTVAVPGLPNQITAAWAQVTPRWLTRAVAGFATRTRG